jgi:hypothetical protein
MYACMKLKENNFFLKKSLHGYFSIEQASYISGA